MTNIDETKAAAESAEQYRAGVKACNLAEVKAKKDAKREERDASAGAAMRDIWFSIVETEKAIETRPFRERSALREVAITQIVEAIRKALLL